MDKNQDDDITIYKKASSNDIDELVKDIKEATTPIAQHNIPEGQALKTKEEIQEFATKKLTQIMSMTVQAFATAAQTVERGGAAEDVLALNQLLKGIGDIADKLQKIAMQDKQIEAAKEIKLLETNTNKEIAAVHGTAALISATRDQIEADRIRRKEAKQAELIDTKKINPAIIDVNTNSK